MSKEGRMISIKSNDQQSFDAWLIEAEATSPAIILIQEIFGINENMRHTAEALAREGYTVCVPDLFWRLGRGIVLNPGSEQDRARAMQLNQAFDQRKGLEDLTATLGHLRATHKRVGTLGFCLGGRLAYLMAARSDADCNVGFYGVAIDKALAEAPNITHPLLLHIAGNDHLCPAEAQAAIREVLQSHALVALYTYPGVGHGFARLGGQSYESAAAELALQRTYDFLHKHLAS